MIIYDFSESKIKKDNFKDWLIANDLNVIDENYERQAMNYWISTLTKNEHLKERTRLLELAYGRKLTDAELEITKDYVLKWDYEKYKKELMGVQ